MLFQDGDMGPWMPFIIAGVTLSMMIISWIPILKFGLIITHAEEKKEWKWVLASSSIQAAAVFSVLFPYFLTSFTGGMHEGPEVGLIIGLMILGLFIDLNIINVLHRVGIKRALLIFILEIIPVVILVSMAMSSGH